MWEISTQITKSLSVAPCSFSSEKAQGITISMSL